MLEKVGLEHSSESTKYELEGFYGDPIHEQFSFLKTAKLPRECNEVVNGNFFQQKVYCVGALNGRFPKVSHLQRCHISRGATSPEVPILRSRLGIFASKTAKKLGGKNTQFTARDLKNQ